MENNMRKILDYIICMLAFICSILTLTRFIYVENTDKYIRENLYARETTVTDINRVADFVTVESESGKKYHFYGAREYYIGDTALLVVHDAGTKFTFDDYVVSNENGGK